MGKRIGNTIAMRAMLTVMRINETYPVEPVGTVPGTPERQILDDLHSLRAGVGCWAARSEVEEALFEKAVSAILRWKMDEDLAA